MADIANFFVTGRIATEPEYAKTQGGITRLSFGVAADRSYKNDAGERHERTTWFRFTIWKGYADFLSKKLFKGMTVTVSGSIEMKEYEGKQQHVFQAKEVIPCAIPRAMWLNPPKAISDWIHQPTGANYQQESGSGQRPRPSRPAPASSAPDTLPPAPPDDDFPVDDDELPF